VNWIKDHPGVQFTVKFMKNDGSMRLMNAISEFNDGNREETKIVKPRPGIMTVYDVDKKQYRSFQESSLVGFQAPQGEWNDIEETRVI